MARVAKKSSRKLVGRSDGGEITSRSFPSYSDSSGILYRIQCQSIEYREI